MADYDDYRTKPIDELFADLLRSLDAPVTAASAANAIALLQVRATFDQTAAIRTAAQTIAAAINADRYAANEARQREDAAVNSGTVLGPDYREPLRMVVDCDECGEHWATNAETPWPWMDHKPNCPTRKPQPKPADFLASTSMEADADDATHEHVWEYDRTICPCGDNHGRCVCGEVQWCRRPNPLPLTDHTIRVTRDGQEVWSGPARMLPDAPIPPTDADPLDESDHRDRLRGDSRLKRESCERWHIYGCAGYQPHGDHTFSLEWWAEGGHDLTFAPEPAPDAPGEAVAAQEPESDPKDAGQAEGPQEPILCHECGHGIDEHQIDECYEGCRMVRCDCDATPYDIARALIEQARSKR